VIPGEPLAKRYSSSTAIVDGRGQLLRLTLAADHQYRLWVPLAQISESLQNAFLLYEDQYFHYHLGVNPIALLRAGWTTFVQKRRRVGASTISMQLARQLYRIHSSTVSGKLEQVFAASLLELRYTKSQILEAYLNLVPMGRNIVGVEAASRIYFGKSARDLSWAEATTLAVIPQNPQRRAPRPKGNPHLAAARETLQHKWLREVADHQPEAAFVQAVVPVKSVRELPFAAPHFVNQVLGQGSLSSRIDTTLQLSLQRLVERVVKRFVTGRKEFGIHNAAALLLEHRNMAVVATMGSANFFSPHIAGQVDGTRAKRGPGSTLKPFVYGLGLEQGRIHPLSVLYDTPQSYGEFVPQNFDGKFDGPIHAQDALVRSRNIPATAIGAQLQAGSLYGLLKTAGVSRLAPEGHYGLSLVLGGAELTMQELAVLYAALANRGLVKALRHRKSDPVDRGKRLLSPQASFLVLQMLAQNPRPDRLGVGENRGQSFPVHWKTGTSNGYRDAWSVGIVGPYVMVVWIGDFNGRGNASYVGRKTAAPLLFAIIDALEASGYPLSSFTAEPPAGVSQLAVCSVTGKLPGPDCLQRKTTWFIPGHSPIETCRVHRRVVIDDRTGLRTCPPFHGPHHEEIFEFWPSDVSQLYAQAGLPRRQPPRLEPRCAQRNEALTGNGPRIRSPDRRVTYLVPEGTHQPTRVAFTAVTDGDVHSLYWFVNKRFAGVTTQGRPLFWKPHPGTFIIRVVDDHGRHDARQITVTRARSSLVQ